MINIDDDPKEIVKELSETEKNILFIKIFFMICTDVLNSFFVFDFMFGFVITFGEIN